MKILKVALLVGFFAGCASNTKTVYSYTQSFDAGYSYQKAMAQCQYEEHLQARADQRADVGSERTIFEIINGKPSRTQIYCMRRFGWELQEKIIEAGSSSSNPNAAKNLAMDDKSLPLTSDEARSQLGKKQFDALVTKEKALCTEPKYGAYFDKSPCSTGAMTAKDIDSDEKITFEDARVARELLSEKQKIQSDQIQVMKTYGNDKVKLRAYVIDKYFLMSLSNWDDLLNRKISWGEYNKAREALDKKMAEELKSIR